MSLFHKQNEQKKTEYLDDPDEGPIIHLENIVKKFYIGTENELEVLHGISLDVFSGEFSAIVGESGSGKSTLMNIIGLLDRPTSGTYDIMGKNVARLKDEALSGIRNRQIGFVFQTYNLIPRTTALKNVEMPMMYARVPQEEPLPGPWPIILLSFLPMSRQEHWIPRPEGRSWTCFISFMRKKERPFF